LKLQGGQRPCQRILGPALRVGLNRVREETVESSKQLGDQRGQAELCHEVGGFGNNVVIAMRQQLAQGFEGSLRRALTQSFQGGKLVFNAALGGHSSRTQDNGLNAERTPAAAGRLDVRVLELES